MSRKWIVVIAVFLGVVVVAGVGVIGSWQYHERPEFCGTCHLMEPYLASWEAGEDAQYGLASNLAPIGT